MIRIVAVGSPIGDDAVGLVVGRRLAHDAPRDAEVLVRNRPGFALVDALRGADAVLLIDATSSGAPAGTLHRIDLRQRRESARVRSHASIHGPGILEAIALAEALGVHPAVLELLGIAIDRPEPGFALSAPVAASVCAAERLARLWAVEQPSRFP